MASSNFKAYDRRLRRIFMQNLVETMERERTGSFRASLVVNPRTGMPMLPQPQDFVRDRRSASSKTNMA